VIALAVNGGKMEPVGVKYLHAPALEVDKAMAPQ
jgi:hypothetical protein